MTDYTTDPEYIALLRTILENPEDDAPRLIIADFIEEHGDQERAEFIRLQVIKGRCLFIPFTVLKCLADSIGANIGSRDFINGVHTTRFEKNNDQCLSAIWSKGFISEIRLSCAEFVGRRCGNCAGRGVWLNLERGRYGELEDCDHCRGTGHIEGVARELFERHPIASVVLVDKRPTSGWWIFVKPGDRDYGRISDTLPVELIHPMSDICHKNPFVGGVSGYYTNAARFADESVAQQALSRAAVAWGRSLVGLPPLK